MLSVGGRGEGGKATECGVGILDREEATGGEVAVVREEEETEGHEESWVGRGRAFSEAGVGVVSSTFLLDLVIILNSMGLSGMASAEVMYPAMVEAATVAGDAR